MHELSIAQEIVNIVKSHLTDSNIKVKFVRLKVGKLSGVLVDSLKFCYDSIVVNTELQESSLEIIEVPIKLKCNDCGHESIINEPYFSCEYCNSINVNLIEGR